jgi:hypothetical protein
VSGFYKNDENSTLLIILLRNGGLVLVKLRIACVGYYENSAFPIVVRNGQGGLLLLPHQHILYYYSSTTKP